MMNERIKVLFVADKDGKSPFPQRDFELIDKNFQTRVSELYGIKFGIGNMQKIMKNFRSYLLSNIQFFKNLMWADVTYSWFATDNSLFSVFFAKWLGKKSIVMIAGGEVVKMKEINYGGMLFFRNSMKVRFILKCASKILAGSESNKKEIMSIYNLDMPIVYHSVDTRKYVSNDSERDGVLTVSYITKDHYVRKGLDRFIEIAREMQDLNFTIAGRILDRSVLNNIELPLNCKITGFLSDSELIRQFQTRLLQFEPEMRGSLLFSG